MHKNNNIKTFSQATVLFIALCHLGIAIFFYIRGEKYNLQAYRWGTLLVLVMLLPYLVAALKKRFIFYEAVYLFLGTFLFSHTVYMFLNLDEIDLDFEVLGYVMKLLTLGVIVFLAGYGFALSKQIAQKLPLRYFIIPKDILKKLPPKLYFIGWLIRFFPFLAKISPRAIPYFGYIVAEAINRIQGWQIVNIIMTDSIYAALMLDAYLYFSRPDPELRIARKTKYLQRLFFFFAIELLYGFKFTGMKEQMLIPIILIFVMYLKTRKKIPYIPIILTAGISIGIIMPFLNNMRHYARNFPIGLSECTRAVFENQYIEGRLPDEQKLIIKRISNPLQMSVLASDLQRSKVEIKMYPDISAYFSRFIPRFLWPNKPIVDLNLLGKKLGVILERDYVTSVGITLIGSFILSGGIYVVIIGMFFVGVILRTYWEWLVVRTGDNPFSFIIYFLLLYPWMRMGAFSLSLHSNISLLVYLYFLLRFLRR